MKLLPLVGVVALLGAAGPARAQQAPITEPGSPPPPSRAEPSTPPPDPAAPASTMGPQAAPSPGGARLERRAAPEGTGTPWIVAGALIAGGGVIDLATSPWCASSRIAPGGRIACAATAVASGVALTGAGVALLAVGAVKRGAWLEHLRVAPAPTGLMLGWGASW